MATFVELPYAQATRARWKWFVAFGIVLAVLGAVALWNVVDATLVTTIYVGFLLLMAGISWIAAGWMARSLPGSTTASPA